MSRFNAPVTSKTRTVNLAGGEAFVESPKLELVSLLLTSFLKDQFYRSAADTLERIRSLIDQAGHLFAAKAAIYARKEAGMRSVSHVIAGELAARSKEPWLASFLDAVVRRPDDVLEITSYYLGQAGGKKVTHPMRRGLGTALTRFDAYQLAKYRGEGKALNLFDVVNLFHPKSTPALAALMKGELKSTETWEAKLTEAGKGSDEAKAQGKKAAWTDLLSRRKLGYMALLKNLRNILEQAPESLPLALEQIQDAEAIRKSLVLPFRFRTAYDELAKVQDSRAVLAALGKACDLSLASVPKLHGKTLVVLDESGSMSGKPGQIGSLFAAVLYRACDADLMTFSERARYQNLDPNSSTLTLAIGLEAEMVGGGTNFHAIFETAARPYERIIILSDMQGWIGLNAPTGTFALYQARTNCRPKIFSFDLQGYGTLQFPETGVYCVAGWSDRVFDMMAACEEGRDTMVKRIEATMIAE